MKKCELKDAIVSLKLEDVTKNFNFKVIAFSIIFLNNKLKPINILGDRINKIALEKINKLKTDSIFYIMIIQFSHHWEGNICKITPIKIMIIDEE